MLNLYALHSLPHKVLKVIAHIFTRMDEWRIRKALNTTVAHFKSFGVSQLTHTVQKFTHNTRVRADTQIHHIIYVIIQSFDMYHTV